MPLPPRIERTVPRPPPKKRDGLDPQHLANIRCLPCLSCGRARPWFTVDPNHLMRVGPGERGMSLKTRDRWCVPACRQCHNYVTDVGNDERWYADRGIDARAVAEALWSVRGDLGKMRRIIERARQAAQLKMRTS